jgi:RimJ/RimL family protein N-acetyltransferase
MPNISFRGFRPVDYDDLWSIATDWPVVRQLGGWKWPADPIQVHSFCTPYARGNGFVQAICRDDRLIGTIGVTDNELGYTVATGHHGLGIGTAAAKWAIGKAWADTTDLALIRAGTWGDNAASHRLLLKLGFQHRQTRYLHARARNRPTLCRSYKLWRSTA